MRNTLTILLLLFLSCGKDPQEKKEQATNTETTQKNEDFQIIPGKRVGMITYQSTEAEVELAYGEDNIDFTSLNIGEGEEQLGVVVFPNTDNEVEIVWEVEASYGRPAFVRLSKEAGDWKTPEGVRVGMTLEALEEANGRPFSFYGFEWDYGGLVTNWDGGNLSPYLVIALIPQNFAAMQEALTGEVILSSDDPKVRKLSPKIGSMVVTFE